MFQLPRSPLLFAATLTLALLNHDAHANPPPPQKPPLGGYWVQDLEDFGSQNRSEAYGINQHGQVTGLTSRATGNPGPWVCWMAGFRYTPNQPLQDLSGVGSCIWGSGINDNGDVSLTYVHAGPHHGPWRYTDARGPEFIGRLPGHTGGATAKINNLGQITGDTSATDPNTGVLDRRPFRYTPGQPLLDLGTLGGTQARGLGIDDFGRVVGHSYLPNTQPTHWNRGHAFLYADGVGMQDMNHLIDPTLGWTLIEASGISANGRYIVGYGRLDHPNLMRGSLSLHCPWREGGEAGGRRDHPLCGWAVREQSPEWT